MEKNNNSKTSQPYKNRFKGKSSNHLLMLMYDVPKNPLKAVTDQPEYVFKVRCFRSQSDKELSALSCATRKSVGYRAAGCFSF